MSPMGGLRASRGGGPRAGRDPRRDASSLSSGGLQTRYGPTAPPTVHATDARSGGPGRRMRFRPDAPRARGTAPRSTSLSRLPGTPALVSRLADVYPVTPGPGIVCGMAHPPAPPLSIGDADRLVRQAVVRAPTAEQRAALRARIVLRCADGIAVEHIARELGVTDTTVRLWRAR